MKKILKIQTSLVQPSWQKNPGSKSVNKTDLTEVLLSSTVVKSGVDQSVLNLWLLTVETALGTSSAVGPRRHLPSTCAELGTEINSWIQKKV